MQFFTKYYFITFLLLFSNAFLYSIEPQELLTQWKAMAEQARIDEIAQYKTGLENLENDNNRHIIYYQKGYDQWLERIRLDHIKILYSETCKIKRMLDGQICDVQVQRTAYIQLERSRLLPFLHLFARYYDFDQQKVNQLITELIGKLPLDKTPKVTVRLSRKKRIEPRFLILEKEMDDLYSVTIDYR